jgi:hypothetical protein
MNGNIVSPCILCLLCCYTAVGLIFMCIIVLLVTVYILCITVSFPFAIG